MSSIRLRTAEVLEVYHEGDKLSLLVDIFLILLISLNTLSIILESVAPWEAQYSRYFYGFEVFSVAIFSVEYLLRVWSSIELDGQELNEGQESHPFRARLRYMLSLSALVDLIAILPFYLSFIFPIDLRFLRVIRLLRIFKLTRYSGAIRVLLAVLSEEKNSLTAAFFVLFIVFIISSSGIYLIEHNIQPDAFGSIPHAMWWSMATLTTVGYGDVTPVTPLGKFFGGLITLVGMGMVAIPAGILASGFSEQLRRRRTIYKDKLHSVLNDGVISVNERNDLNHLRSRLGLTVDDAIALTQAARNLRGRRDDHCPHCHKPITLASTRRNEQPDDS